MEPSEDLETADATNYGYARRLMKNMGWGGVRLGLNENGIAEPIRVRTRSKPTGLGYYERHDQCTDRQQDFNELLERLNEGLVTESTNSNGFSSLEKRSKSSRSRVHYHKFTRGKDLSRYSEQDMVAILGKRRRGDTDAQGGFVTSTETSNRELDNVGEGEVAIGSAEVQKSKRRRSKKVSFGANLTDVHEISRESEDTNDTTPVEEDGATSDIIDSGLLNDEHDSPKRRKKSKKKTRPQDNLALFENESCHAEELSSVEGDGALMDDSVSRHRNKNKRKRKSVNVDEPAACVSSVYSRDSLNTEDASSSYRKEQKRKMEGLHDSDNCVKSGAEKGDGESKDRRKKDKQSNASEYTDIIEYEVTDPIATDNYNDNLQVALTTECVKPKKHVQQNAQVASDKELQLTSIANEENTFGTDQCNASPKEAQDPVCKNEMNENMVNYEKHNWAGKRHRESSSNLQKTASLADFLQRNNINSSMKRSKGSLKTLIRNMKSISMFEGSNFLSISGYPE